MKYRIVRNGLGEYGVIDPKDKLCPVDFKYLRSSVREIYWTDSLTIVRDRRDVLQHHYDNHNKRGTWEVVE